MVAGKIHFLLRSCLGLTAMFIAYGFGSQGKSIIITGQNFFFCGLLLFCFVILYRLYSFRFYILFGKRVVFLSYYLLFFLSALYMSFLRIYLAPHFLIGFVSFLGIFVVSPVQPLPGPANSPPNEEYHHLWAQPPELGWLDEAPAAQAEGAQAAAQAPVAAPEQLPVALLPNRDFGFEAALRTRVELLERVHSPFLPQDQRGEFWESVKKNLAGAPDQKEYNRRLRFESHDLLVREHKDTCLRLFRAIWENHSELNPGLNPEDAFKEFVQEFEKEFIKKDHRAAGARQQRLDCFPTAEEELQFVMEVTKDLHKKGHTSSSFRKIAELK